MINTYDSKILILGASGQLGSCIKKVVEDRGHTGVIFPDENSANILNKTSLEVLFSESKPDYVINCAAYTAVDKAEDEIELCRQVNRDGALNIALMCKKYGAVLMHVSTDFVFAGDTTDLLKEYDEAKPRNVYGLTKLEGEIEVAEVLPEHFIVRTSWLYSEYGNNFVKTMLKLGAERDALNIITDQIGSPTYAMDLAEALLMIIYSGQTKYGIYHYSNEGIASWYDFAVAIFALGEVNVKVSPIPSTQYPTRAERPKFSVLSKAKIKTELNIEVPYWRDSLATCIERIKMTQLNTTL